MRYFRRKLDDKNRLTIPAELRGEFKTGKIIITKGFQDYLHLYSEKVWEAQFQAATKGRGGEAMPILFDEALANRADALIEGWPKPPWTKNRVASLSTVSSSNMPVSTPTARW